MRKMKKESGITMLILVITVIVLGIIASIVIHYSISGKEYSEEKKLLANLEAVKHAVYQQYEEYKMTEDKSLLVGELATEDEKKELQDNEWQLTSSKEADGKYYKLTKKDLEEIGIKNETDEYIVNYKTGECFNLTKKRTEENHHELYIK